MLRRAKPLTIAHISCRLFWTQCYFCILCFAVVKNTRTWWCRILFIMVQFIMRSLWLHSAWRICSLEPQIWGLRRQLVSQPTHEGTVGHVMFQRQQVGQAFVESLCFSSHTTWGWRYKWGEDQCLQVYIATRFTHVRTKSATIIVSYLTCQEFLGEHRLPWSLRQCKRNSASIQDGSRRG